MPKFSTIHRFGVAISHLRLWAGRLWVWEARLRGAEFQGAAHFQGRPLIAVALGSRMVFGRNTWINSALRSNPLGCFQPSVLRTLAPGAELILEKDSGLSGAVLCAGRRIRVGEGTIIGAGAVIIDNDFHAYDERLGWVNECQANARPIEIGRHVFIGARAIILKGVSIGDKSIIGAGAVVTRSVPPLHLASGNPARVKPLQALAPAPPAPEKG